MSKQKGRSRPTPARPRTAPPSVAEIADEAAVDSAPEAADVLDFLTRKRKPREVITELVLDNDLLDEWTEAQADLAANEDIEGNLRLAGGTKRSSRELAERVREIEDRIEASKVRFRFVQTDPEVWQAICDEHPPRQNNLLDLHAGFNQDAVLDEAIAVCLVEPEFTRKQLAEFRKKLNPSEWKELREAVDQVNGRVSQAPKSALASRILRPRGSDFALPEAGE